jgi:hypothetical protein
MAEQETIDLVALEDRPTGDFIDGFLAALASLTAALAGAPANSFFFSFDWIGDCAAPREPMLAKAFQSSPDALSLQVEALADWRETVRATGRRWLAHGMNDAQAAAVAREFSEILEAYFASAELKTFVVRPSPAPGAPALTRVLGVEHEHILFETEEGRLLLEFSRDS